MNDLIPVPPVCLCWAFFQFTEQSISTFLCFNKIYIQTLGNIQYYPSTLLLYYDECFFQLEHRCIEHANIALNLKIIALSLKTIAFSLKECEKTARRSRATKKSGKWEAQEILGFGKNSNQWICFFFSYNVNNVIWKWNFAKW